MPKNYGGYKVMDLMAEWMVYRSIVVKRVRDRNGGARKWRWVSIVCRMRSIRVIVLLLPVTGHVQIYLDICNTPLRVYYGSVKMLEYCTNWLFICMRVWIVHGVFSRLSVKVLRDKKRSDVLVAIYRYFISQFSNSF
jgi:hypothetical protein